MKLITKNLTGYLDNGDKYEICFEDKKCDILKHKRLISVCRYVFNEFLNDWFLDVVTCVSYQFKDEYKEALKTAITNAENDFNINLLKSKIKKVA